MMPLFPGFDRQSVRHSALDRRLAAVIFSLEADLRCSTSTPNNNRSRRATAMEVSSSSSFLHPLDYDSGYVSHNHESNSDSSLENLCVVGEINYLSKPIYLCEDALLERPDINVRDFNISAEIEKEDFEEATRLFNLEDDLEVIVASVPSVRTEFSGFSNESKECDVSLEIPLAEAILYCDSRKPDLIVAEPMEVAEAEVLPALEIVDPVKPQTPVKQFVNPVDPGCSPDLFDEEEPVVQAPKSEEVPSDFIAEEQYVLRKDARLLKRIQNGLNGVLPPPSVTTVNISVVNMLEKLEANKEFFWTGYKHQDAETKLNTSDSLNCEHSRSLLVTVPDAEGVQGEFPKIMTERFHGFHYNRSKLSEEIELLCDKYGQRCVGAETQSTCTVFEALNASPSKRRPQKSRWTAKSPGRRLSHLARRRITFSSANLNNGGGIQQQAPSTAGLRARQIMVDAKNCSRKLLARSPRKTPKKKTPNKSPKIKTRTPSSSAKKKLAMRFRILSGEFEGSNVPSTSSEHLVMSSKRALFQSPSKSEKSIFPSSSGSCSSSSADGRKPATKRALFTSPHKRSPMKKHLGKSPFKNSPSKLATLKRKRPEEEAGNVAKMPRSMSSTVVTTLRTSDSEGGGGTLLQRTKSEFSALRGGAGQLSEMTELQKKKIQWAVYEALRAHNISTGHPQFKIFASILARVTRRFYLSANGTKSESGVSDKMLRIARHHAYAVVKGKSVDEIVNEYLKTKTAKVVKPQGYVGIEEFNRLQGEAMPNKENVLQDRLKMDAGAALPSVEKRKFEVEKAKPLGDNRVERIRRVIKFGDDEVR